MRQRNTKPESQETIDSRITARLDEPLAKRFLQVVEASKRSKTSILEECIDRVLPDLEKQYLRRAA